MFEEPIGTPNLLFHRCLECRSKFESEHVSKKIPILTSILHDSMRSAKGPIIKRII